METRVVAEFLSNECFLALRQAYPQRVAALVKRFSLCINKELPKPILLLILSMCWKNSLTFMLVCKLWGELVHTAAYWRRAYLEKLLPLIPKNFPAAALHYYRFNFHTFDDEFFSSFYAKVGWLFSKRLVRESIVIVTKFHFFEKNNEWLLRFKHTVGTSDTVNIEYLTGATFTHVCSRPNHGYIVKQCYGTEKCIYARQSDDKSREYQQIDWVDRDIDLRWQGTGWSDGVPYIPFPEGAGKWTLFSTGEVLLEGRDVAHRGRMDDDGKTWHRGKRMKIVK